MTDLTLTKSRIAAGKWEGVLEGALGDDTPQLAVTLFDKQIEGLEVVQADKKCAWHVAFEIPLEHLAEGVQTFLFVDLATYTTLASFAMLSGEAMADDIRAEMDLLRAELDMLKKAFRRHCIETM